MRYQLLGPFDAFDDGGQSLALGGERQRALLALLVINANEVVSVDRIIDSLWESDPPETANNIVQVYVSRLRKAVESGLGKGDKPTVFLTRRPGYLLRVTDGQVDATEFSRMANEGRLAIEAGNPGLAATHLRSALALWKGEALADFAYEGFAVPVVARLTEERIGAMEDLVEARLALGEHDQLIPELEALVGRYRLRERLHGQLMLAHYRSGHQGDALRAYRQAAEVLVDELGIDPGAELQRLELRILNQDPTLQVDRVAGDQADALPMIGRDRHVAALSEAVAMVKAGGSVLVRVIGEPGTGVARLLDEVTALSERAGLEVYRARAFEGELSGFLADQVTPTSDAPSSIIIEAAHHGDPTTIGRVGRRLRSGHPTLAVLGQIPLEGRPARALANLGAGVSHVDLTVDRVSKAEIVTVAGATFGDWLYDRTNGDSFELGRLLGLLRERGMLTVFRGQVSFAGSRFPDDLAAPLGAQVAELDEVDRLLVEACSVAASQVPLRVLADLVEMSSMDTVDRLDRLVAEGFLEESERGVTVSGALTSGRLPERIGPTRRSAVAGALAAAWKDQIEPAYEGAFGFVAEAGGEFDLAASYLIGAADRAMERQNLSEAQPLLEAAVRAMVARGEESGPRWGHVHLALAACHRLAGWPDLAAASLDEAIDHAEGAEKVDAWGWAAQVASDRQDPSDAEWMTSIGQWRALRIGAPAKAASLLSLQGQVLNRLGFPDEADLCSSRGRQILSRIGEPHQEFLASYNQAWIDFDRGHARRAEAGFARLLERLGDETDARFADLSAWRARSLYRLGRVDEAEQAADLAMHLGTRSGDIGPVFLTYMARSEGAAMYGHGPDTVVAANEMLGVVLQQLPAWENAARFLLAKGHLANGSLAAAADEAANAVETCPDGVGGRRWRLACQSLVQLIECEQGRSLGHESDQLIEDLLAARWNESAIDLLVARCVVRSDPASGLQAAELAVTLGLAPAAGRATAALRRLGEPLDPATSDGADRMVRRALRTMPARWAAGFARLVDADQPNR